MASARAEDEGARASWAETLDEALIKFDRGGARELYGAPAGS